MVMLRDLLVSGRSAPYSSDVGSTERAGGVVHQRLNDIFGILGKSGGLLYVAPNSLLFGETPLGSNKEQAIILANQSSGTALNLDYFVSGDVDQFALVDGQG